MSLRTMPAAATWFLELFCSGPEHDSVIGDLFEEYHRGRGRSWYWRQVLVIVFFGLYRGTARRRLTRRNRFSEKPRWARVLLVSGFGILVMYDTRVSEAVFVVILAMVWGFLGRGIVACWHMRHSRVVQVLDLHNRKTSSIRHFAPLVGTKPLGLIHLD
jgi:hypothetical protein